MDICFATNNLHKIEEVSRLVGNNIHLLSLKDIGCETELPENQATLEGNSLEKAEYVYQHYKIPCFADDTGLEVNALNGAPGVYSARFAGPQKNSQDNIKLLLEKLEGNTDRSARFRTVITLMTGSEVNHFEGIVRGTIAEKLSGNSGFGYDPVFIPKGYDISFAEMSTAQKNQISHRGIAIRKLTDFLRNRL
jgi:XTP/dITP diphosphohydrolase